MKINSEKITRFACNIATLPMVLFLAAQSANASANEVEFSAPTTAPEKALHAILQWRGRVFGERSSNLTEFLTQRSGRSKANDARYKRMFTMGLVRAISAVDRSMTDKDCDGVCGLDFDPIFCAQDILLPPHTYLTTSKERANGGRLNTASRDSRAYVLYRRGRADEKYVHRIDYLLEKESGIWKIAGVYCSADLENFGTKFNAQ